MAKKDEQKAKPSENGHNKVQGFVFGIHLEGNKDVVMEGIKSFTAAMTAGGAATFATPTRKPAALPSGGKGAGVATATIDAEEHEATQVADLPEEEATVPDAEEEESESASNGSKPARRVPKTPVVLNDIDFNTGKIMPLKDFVNQKNPTDAYERYAVFAVWYKDNHGVEEVNADRIYTAYKFMDLIPPNDVGQVLRDLKSSPSKKWFDKGSGKGAYKINIIGLNKVAAGFGN